jgi:hypothetical protein
MEAKVLFFGNMVRTAVDFGQRLAPAERDGGFP